MGSESLSPATSFGHRMRKEFLLAEGFTNFNHGSFGCTPRKVIDRQRAYTDQMEAYPDLWFRGVYFKYIEQVQADLGKYVGADAADMVLIENASAGVNAIFRSLKLTSSDAVLITSIAYSMVPNTLRWLAEREGFSIVVANLTLPVAGPDAIVDAVRQTLDANPHVKVASFSHISSIPALVMPVTELIALCRARNVSVLVDGAHALGQIPIDLSTLQPDFYIANAHKWLFGPKGSAFLWVRPSLQSQIVPTVISSSGKTDFLGEFEYTGTRDYTAFCSISEGLKFRDEFGEFGIMEYNRQLSIWAGHELAAMWNTETMCPDSMVAAMNNIRLPTTDPAKANALTQQLMEKYNMYLVVVNINGAFWTRISAQIYLEQSDFKLLGARVLELLQ